MNTYIWFTYADNEKMLIQSVRSVMANVTTEKRVCIVFDTFDPNNAISSSTVDEISKLQSKYDTECIITNSTFDRRHNLNGIECVRGMLDVFRRFGEKSEAIFKIDDDVIIYKQNYINKFLSDNKILSLWSQRYIVNPGDEKYIYGSFYGMKSGLIEEIIREVNHANSLEEYIARVVSTDNIVASYLPEDQTFSLMVSSATADYEKMLVPFVVGDGFFAGWQYKNKTYANAYRHYDIITFGNRGLVPSKNPTEIRNIIADTMRDSLDEYLSTKP